MSRRWRGRLQRNSLSLAYVAIMFRYFSIRHSGFIHLSLFMYSNLFIFIPIHLFYSILFKKSHYLLFTQIIYGIEHDPKSLHISAKRTPIFYGLYSDNVALFYLWSSSILFSPVTLRARFIRSNFGVATEKYWSIELFSLNWTCQPLNNI